MSQISIKAAFDQLDRAIEQARADMNSTVTIPATTAVAIADVRRPRSIDDWGEDMGPQLWWKFPVDEEPYSGTPNDHGRTIEVAVDDGVNRTARTFDVAPFPDYLTHFTPIIVPIRPFAASAPLTPPPGSRECMRAALIAARDAFERYAALHDANGTDEGRHHAEVNRARARAITEALGDG